MHKRLAVATRFVHAFERLSKMVVALLLVATLVNFVGCVKVSTEPADSTVMWGRRGIGKARFQKPRAITLIPGVAVKTADESSEGEGAQEQLYVVDMTARIQSFDLDGGHIHDWRTPKFKTGKPCGLSVSNDGLLMVADTHYHRVLFYTPEGELVPSRTLGGTLGRGPGEFGFVTDVAQDSKDNYYVGEYGDFDRIQKFDSSGKFILEWGGHGTEPGEFLRPQGLTIDKNDYLWVADASNHRIQIFDATGDKAELVATWGEQGSAVGQLSYPYDLAFDADGNVLVCEFGNHRVQKFTRDGTSLGFWGGPGRQLGQLYQPWDICLDSRGRLHVLDSYNHRVQRVDCDRWDWQGTIDQTE